MQQSEFMVKYKNYTCNKTHPGTHKNAPPLRG